MNVIIRLQNLPWSANATDIRTFFKGLMIPEGGVHIVGGENGDAFIAFSSDEDARQAMQMNGGKLKETQVSLLLSSRAEMQKVIEKARQASSVSFMNKVTAAPSPQVLSAAAIANQFAKKLEPPSAVVPPQPPIISLTNFLTQSMQQQNSQHAPVSQAQLLSAYQQMPPTEIPGLAGLNSASTALGMQQNAASAAAAAAYANYYATLIDPNALNYVNTISGLAPKSIEPQSQPLSFNNDPRNRRSNSRDRNLNRRNRSRSPERKHGYRSSSRDRFIESDKDGRDSNSRRRTRFSAADDIPNNSIQKPSPAAAHVAAYSIPPPVSNSVWDNPPPQVFSNNQITQNKPQNAFAMFSQNGNSSLPPARHYQTENKSSSSSAFGDIGTCIKVSNVDNETYYSDLRKFFGGLQIGQNDIKFVTDSKGNRSGVVLVRFLTSDSKKKALTKSMWQLKSTQVMITSISEEDFESGLNTPKPANRNNYRTDDRQDSRNDRHRERSRSKDRDVQRNFNRNDGGNRNNRNFDDRNNRDQGNFRERNQRNFKQEEKPKNEFKPDENFKVLIIDDIPRVANEPDILEAFPNISSIIIDRSTAYVKFTTHEAAKVTLENRFIHYIRNKRVFLEAGSEAQFSELSRKLGKYDNPDVEQVNDNGSESKFDHMNEDSNSRDSKPFESRDPRNRNFNNERNFNNGPPMNLKTDCVIVKNMEPDTKIEDVENFFKDLGIFKTRVHILLDKKGQPCGDCFVEFKYPNDTQKAITKNNEMMKNNRVQVMMIPREQVEAVLSSFGGDRGDNSMRPQRDAGPPRNDWAPPNDFGNPGCVLMLSNLCYRAEIEDILDVFNEFELRPDQIIRRFNDIGQPTGNACINFNSPADADLAIDKYNSVKVMNRSVWLKRV